MNQYDKLDRHTQFLHYIRTIQNAVRSANNILDFLGSEGYLTFNEECEASTKELYETYKAWCEDNAEVTLSAKSFANQMAQHATAFNLIPDYNIYIGNGRRCRGYRGIGVIDTDNPFYKK